MKLLRYFCAFLAVFALLLCPARAGGEAPLGYVALTFDDGPSPATTARLLELLAQREVEATFFVCGYRLAELPELAARYAGHEIGIHGYTHAYLHKATLDQDRRELEDTRAELDRFGLTPTLFRAPGGLMSDDLRQAAREAGLPVMLWSVDPRDWECQDADTVARRVLDQVQAGDVILMHELFPSSVQAAGRIIDGLRQRGLEPVTVSQLARFYGLELVPGEEYRAFAP